jgi:hypothetical protein
MRRPALPTMHDIYIDALRNNPCPYATACRYDLAPVWKGVDFSREDISRLASDLRTFALGGDEVTEDVFVLAIEDCSHLTLGQATRTLRNVLVELRSMDSMTKRCLSEGIENRGWDFMFEGTAFFVMLLAPFYPTFHSRHSALSDIAFIVFHPERTFRRFGISSKRHNRRELSERIATLFSVRGKPYRLFDVCELTKARRYVKPISIDGAPLAWWETD